MNKKTLNKKNFADKAVKLCKQKIEKIGESQYATAMKHVQKFNEYNNKKMQIK